ncbi:MAG: hypothetical protein KDH96_08995 [Candidatus Riesia sp.]|nr:hypothetical protein [Candidatus Riesia sp.]
MVGVLGLDVLQRKGLRVLNGFNPEELKAIEERLLRLPGRNHVAMADRLGLAVEAVKDDYTCVCYLFIEGFEQGEIYVQDRAWRLVGTIFYSYFEDNEGGGWKESFNVAVFYGYGP